MIEKYIMRYFAAFLVFIALILFGIVIFGGNSNKSNSSTSTSSQVTKALPDYASSNAEVRVTIDGPVNGDDLHRQIRMTISSSQRTIDIIQGYQGNVIQTESIGNNQPAYNVFLNAIYRYGFTLGLNPKKNKFVSTNDVGSCPLGDRYYFELMNTGSNADQRLWTSTCGKQVPGNFGGDSVTLLQLFRVQYTNYDDFTSGVVI